MPPERLHALLINGGGDRDNNFASHLSHLRQIVGLLERGRVARNHVTILASDGSNPAPDLAVAEPEPEGSWLLDGTAVGDRLRATTGFENSALDGYTLLPATRAELRRTFAGLKTRVRPGDTLLVFVTDHGTSNLRDPQDNRITLWGEKESLSVRELRKLFAGLPDNVRVVTLMSQCFSGGFAYLYDWRSKSRLPSGATCGYFSSTADRPAYGCYPEVRGAEAVGHAFEFLQAFSQTGRFSTTQDQVVVSDTSPDVPLRSSDAFLDELLLRAAPGRRDEGSKFVDDILGKVWKEARAAADRRSLDRLAVQFGLPRLQSATLAELNQRGEELAKFLDKIEAQVKVWAAALGDLNQARLDAFVAGHREFAPRLALPALRKLNAKERRALTVELLRELVASAEADPPLLSRLHRLVKATDGLDKIVYRAEVRMAALLRMRTILIDVAGRYFLRTQAKPSEVAALAALERCEDLSFTLSGVAAGKPAAKAALPSLAADEKEAARFQPAWLGFAFGPIPANRRKRLGLPDKAVRVLSVVDKAPAARAGLRAGDILLGAAGQPFAGQNPLRPAVVLAPLDAEWPIDVQRGSKKLGLRVRPQPVPEPDLARAGR